MGRQADAIGANLEAALSGVAKALTLEVEAQLKMACPVDTGHARRNFVASVGTAYDGEDGGAAQQAGEVAVLAYRIGDGDLFVANNVPYIDALVLGSSSQAPAGFDLVAADTAVANVQAAYGVSIDVTSGSDLAARGAQAAQGLASAFSPFGDE